MTAKNSNAIAFEYNFIRHRIHDAGGNFVEVAGVFSA
jgi:hypothetical protein